MMLQNCDQFLCSFMDSKPSILSNRTPLQQKVVEVVAAAVEVAVAVEEVFSQPLLQGEVVEQCNLPSSLMFANIRGYSRNISNLYVISLKVFRICVILFENYLCQLSRLRCCLHHVRVYLNSRAMRSSFFKGKSMGNKNNTQPTS